MESHNAPDIAAVDMYTRGASQYKMSSHQYRDSLVEDIQNNAWVTVNNNFWCHEWGHLPINFMRDEVISENHWQIASQVIKKLLFTCNESIISFLTHYFMSQTHNSSKNYYWSLISPLLLRTILSDLALWRHGSRAVMSPECRVLALWHHISRLFLHAQIHARWSSLVNNNSEYQFLATWYSRLSV